MIEEGFCLPAERREALSKKIGRELPDEVWQYYITGYRILVVPEPVSERTRGLLYKPRSAVEREQLESGSGWVIAVGHFVGHPGATYPGGCACDAPSDLLGRRILYRSHQGVNLKTSDEDTEFGGNHSLLVMTDRDILAIGSEEEGV